MRVLILGGTWFLGRTLAELAVARGFAVTCFNRGRAGHDVPGVHTVHGDRTDPASVARLASHGPWDAVIDTSAYEPGDALITAAALRDVVGSYALISTVAVYRDWPAEPVDESSPVWACRLQARASDADLAQMPRTVVYGTLKSGCELAVREAFGDRALIVRPGVVLGPYEYVGRLPALLRRAARGGAMLAAGEPGRPIQPIDVRDLATFVLDTIGAGVTGDFNATAPVGHCTYGDLLSACVKATGSDAHLTWASGEWLSAQGVQQWTQMPLWRMGAGTWTVDSAAASGAGLVSRPIQDTARDTWAWLQAEEPVPHARAARHGLSAERENELLLAWARQGQERRSG